MLSEKDFEKLWFLYKLEGEPRNISIEEFCERQGVRPELFTQWLKCRQKKIVKVQVEGAPSSDVPETPQIQNPSAEFCSKVVVKSVQIVLHGGMLLAKRNLSYQDLRLLVEKLEVLC